MSHPDVPVTDADEVLDAFADALSAASERLAHLREPRVDSDQKKAFSAELLAWLYDGGWVRWGWPDEIGGLAGSATIRCQIYERLRCAAP